MLFCMLP
jgi:hypothetical protein